MHIYTLGGPRNIEFLRIGNHMWPLGETYAPTQFFYSALDVSRTWDYHGKNETSNVRHFENPEVYWQCHMGSSKPHIDSFRETEDPQAEYDQAMQDYMERLTTFRESNKAWYKNRSAMMEDMTGYIHNIRQQTGAQSSYPAEGYHITRSSEAIYDANIM